MQADVVFGDRSVDWSRITTPPDVTALVQVHGARVVVVDAPGSAAGVEADAAVTEVPGARLLIRTADCAPVALLGRRNGSLVAVGAVHAGWKGLRDGVLVAAVDALRSLGATDVAALLGPSIGPECYEFGDRELHELVDALGSSVVGRTVDGRPALDMTAGVRASLALAGVGLDTAAWQCTSCDEARYFSHRARRDTGRQGLLVSMRTDAS